LGPIPRVEPSSGTHVQVWRFHDTFGVIVAVNVTGFGIVSSDTFGLAVTVSFGSFTVRLIAFDFTSPLTFAKTVKVPDRVSVAVHARLGGSPVVGRKLPDPQGWFW
jgi:hypothetical protein